MTNWVDRLFDSGGQDRTCDVTGTGTGQWEEDARVTSLCLHGFWWGDGGKEGCRTTT